MFAPLSARGTGPSRRLYNANGTDSDKNPPKCPICDKNGDDGVKLSKQEENELFPTATAAIANGGYWPGTYRIGKSGHESDGESEHDGYSDVESVGEHGGRRGSGSMHRRGSGYGDEHELMPRRGSRYGSGTKSGGDCVCMRCTTENNSNGQVQNRKVPNGQVPNGQEPFLVHGRDPRGLARMMGGRSSLSGLYTPPEVENTYTPMLPGAGQGGPLNTYPNPFARSNSGDRGTYPRNGGGGGLPQSHGGGRGPGRSLYSGDRSLYSSDDGRGLAYRQGYGHKEGELDGSFRSWNNGSKHF